MIRPEEAKSIIMAHLIRSEPEQVMLDQAIGRVTTEAIFTDRDYPPYHRATMDGFAFTSLDHSIGEFPIAGMLLAGAPPGKLKAGSAIEIMTGAAMPENSDCVVPYEKCTVHEKDGEYKVVVPGQELTPFLNVHQKGMDATSGQMIVPKGATINSLQIAAAASFGYKHLAVQKRPKIALISTGNELSFESEVRDYQIRPSNIISIGSLLTHHHISYSNFHFLDDERAMLETLSEMIHQFDIFIFSGGVSKGKADFLPSVLKKSGVKELFHGVTQKPGKPFWFGKSIDALFFGLPGNPISSSVCFLKYILPMIVPFQEQKVVLGFDFQPKNGLTHFVPVVLEKSEIDNKAVEIKNNGSGDFINTSRAHGFVELSWKETMYSIGDIVTFYGF